LWVNVTFWVVPDCHVTAVLGAVTVIVDADTTSETVAVCVRLPLTPIIVSVYVPAGVLALVVTASVDVVVAGFALKLPVAPVGSPLTLSVTALAKPPVGLIVTP
jgi:hypothetical protein